MRCGDYLVAEYTYNTFGERIKKVTYSGNQKTVTYYFYDGHTLTAEANEQGEIQSQYIYLKHQPIAKLEGKTIYAIHSDHLGTPRVATNDDKQTVWQANYSPFGKAEITKQSITLNLRLPGQYEDQETGTHYNYLRDYDPETGRYITSDPIGLRGGVNTYAYVDNSPLSKTDRLGLKPEAQQNFDGSWTITGGQYKKLEKLALNNQRPEYYVMLYNITGYKLFAEMAQISSNSGFLGGVAWRANLAIVQDDKYDSIYPGNSTMNDLERISEFSSIIFRDDFSQIKQVGCSTDGGIFNIPTQLDLTFAAWKVWDNLGLGNPAPPLVRYIQERFGTAAVAAMMAGETIPGGETFLEQLGAKHVDAFDIVRDALIAERTSQIPFGEDPKGFYEDEFIKDHEGINNVTIEYTKDGKYKILKAKRSLVQEDNSNYNNYEAVKSHPEFDIIVLPN